MIKIINKKKVKEGKCPYLPLSTDALECSSLEIILAAPMAQGII